MVSFEKLLSLLKCRSKAENKKPLIFLDHPVYSESSSKIKGSFVLALRKFRAQNIDRNAVESRQNSVQRCPQPVSWSDLWRQFEEDKRHELVHRSVEKLFRNKIQSTSVVLRNTQYRFTTSVLFQNHFSTLRCACLCLLPSSNWRQRSLHDTG